MRETLYKVIKSNRQGLFLLDPPTGFGKTTVVLDLIRAYLKGDSAFSNVKRLFFITNLKNNLPFRELMDELDTDQKKQCFLARATDEYIIEYLSETQIHDQTIISSSEYKNLKNEVETYVSLHKNYEEEAVESKRTSLWKSIGILGNKIASDTEPAFRALIKNRYFYNKSVYEKKKFIDSNSWFKKLYPICEIEKYKVIFLTTKRFILPIDTFKRMPFYIYNDEMAQDSVFFIDEFDSTKQILLDQIVEDGLKHKTDIIKLFLDVNFGLQNLKLPKLLLKTTDYHKEKEKSLDGEKHWYSTQDHFDFLRKEFKTTFDELNLKYLIKSEDFKYDRAFLFDDGNYFNVIKDSSKKLICATLREQDDYLALVELSSPEKSIQINLLLRRVESNIEGFARSVFFIANNFKFYKNSLKQPHEVQYTLEEAIFSVLDVLNLSDDEKLYLFEKIINFDNSFNHTEQNEEMRRGFKFTEIEDSNYHDIKSIIHNFNFYNTPEDILIKLVRKAMVIGISATANVNTCIGNYDLTYLRKMLQDRFIAIDKNSEERIAREFNAMINETKGKYKINIDIPDDVDLFSDKEKCRFFIDKIFGAKYKQKYEEILNQDKINTYYFLIELKLAYIYADMKIKGYKSFIGFLNKFPRNNDSFNRERLLNMFFEIDDLTPGQPITIEIVEANNFDYKFGVIYKNLAAGKAVFVLTTYQTIGTGKNIQYEIPEADKESVIYCANDTHGTKDFDAIYLLTPTYLIQSLNYKSDNKYFDLAKYLFHQEYLYQNKYLNYYEMKLNIANGFRQTFFQDQPPFYVKNGDLYANSLRLIIQAVGRICRCRNKNKQIYIYSDKEVIERIRTACQTSRPNLMNEEFRALLNAEFKNKNELVFEEYSKLCEKTYLAIRQAARTVRNSLKNVYAWQDLRDYVLQNPTSDYILPQYQDFYFKFENRYSGYCYRYGKNYSIKDIKTDLRYQDMPQVSEQACNLPVIFSTCPYLEQAFESKRYATTFKRGKFIMNPYLFKFIYLGALGEVIGREIISNESGYALQELSDVEHYEFFDYQYGNIYFDFKHWDKFRVDADLYSKKIKNKLSKIKGEKCFIINLIKRSNAESMISNDETIIQIPYLIDPQNETLNEKAIDYISRILTNVTPHGGDV